MRRSVARVGLAALLLVAAPGVQSRAQPDVAARFEDRAPVGPSVAERLGEIRRRVQAALVYPELARARGVRGEARVAFEIGADGLPQNVTLAETSGSPSLDRAAERALRAAGALPYVAGRVTVPVRFALVED